MDTFKKTIEGVELTFTSREYDSTQQKVMVQFVLDESGYQNAEVMSKSIVVNEEHPVIAKLTEWAETIIKDRIATKKRQEEEAAAEAEAAEDNQE